jgi:hypothetical protein
MRSKLSDADAVTETAGPPTVAVLRRGVILRSILNAVMLVKQPDLARFMSWDGRNYVINNADGAYGAVTFDRVGVVGVFLDSQVRNARRAPDGGDHRDYLFSGMPSQLRSVAQSETLRYNRMSDRPESLAEITAAFWSKGERLIAAVPWREMLDSGGHVIRIEIMPDTEAALKEWQDAYQCSPAELDFARSLFNRSLSEGSAMVTLTAREVDWLRGRSTNAEAYAECLIALRSLNIVPAETSPGINQL